ncbi:MFS transporter [bacterium]|nr:MFS transporter [bacterium]
MDQTASSPKEKLILILLTAIGFAHVVDFMVMMPLGPQLMRIFNISPGQFGQIVSAYGISSGVAGLLVGPMIDKYDRKKFMAFCLVGLAAGTLLCGVAPTASVLVLARCIAGFFGGILGGLSQAIISDVFPAQRRGYAISRVMAAFSIASVLGVPVSLALANKFGWHTPFILVTAMLSILLVTTILRFPSLTGHIDPQSTLKGRVKQLSHLMFEKSALIGFLATFFIVFGQFMVIPFISPYLVKNLGFSESQLPLLYFLGGFASIFTMPLIGKWTDSFGAAKLFPIGVVVSIIPLFSLTHLTSSNPVIILSVTTFFMICMGGRMVPFTSLLTTVVEPKKRGGFLSLNASVQSLAQGGAALFAASLVHESADGSLQGYGTSGWIAAIFSLVTIALGLQIAKAGARSAPQTDSRMPSQPLPTSESVDPS